MMVTNYSGAAVVFFEVAVLGDRISQKSEYLHKKTREVNKKNVFWEILELSQQTLCEKDWVLLENKLSFANCN